jgi:hypothetical protein
MTRTVATLTSTQDKRSPSCDGRPGGRARDVWAFSGLSGGGSVKPCFELSRLSTGNWQKCQLRLSLRASSGRRPVQNNLRAQAIGQILETIRSQKSAEVIQSSGTLKQLSLEGSEI